METISINTTQNIALDYEIASVGDRILATIIDYVIFIAWIILCFVVLKLKDEFAVLFIAVAPLVFYHLAMETLFNGQSVGKMAMKIKVIKMDGSEPTFGAYIMRWIMRIVDMGLFSGLVALVAVVVNGKGQRLGDMAAGTTVISLKKRVQLHETVYKVNDENYQVTFREATNLNDKDVIKIKMVFNEAMKKQQYAIIDELAEKVRQTLNISTTLASEEFLRTLIRDYNHLMSDI
ncbi:MAG: RDD family protein [Bacteroidia bacterium]